VFRLPRARGVDGAVLGPEAFVLRFFGGTDGDRLLLVNLGSDLKLESVAEPLLAPLQDATWKLQWSSEAPEYEGNGTPTIVDGGWRIPGETAVVLMPVSQRSEVNDGICAPD